MEKGYIDESIDFEKSLSVQVPVIAQGRLICVIYVETIKLDSDFTPSDKVLIQETGMMLGFRLSRMIENVKLLHLREEIKNVGQMMISLRDIISNKQFIIEARN